MRLTVLALLAVAAIATSFVAADDSVESRTLTGGYSWNQAGKDGALEAVFTATGEGRWSVDFHFNFQGKDRTYSGTAEGSLSAGELNGKVQDESKKRTFSFSGRFNEGTFSGTHAEIEGGKEYSTGSLTLN